MRALLFPVLCALLGSVAQAAPEEAKGPEPLPDPLTLEAAMAIADKVHPDVMLSAARIDAANAGLLGAQSASDATLTFSAQLRGVEPHERLGDRERNDSQAALKLSKRLYDFGLSEAREQAASEALKGAEWQYLDARQRHRLAVMQAYFDVLLADLAYARDNEEIATVFIPFNKARDKQKLEPGRVSDFEVLQLEAKFQKVRARWVNSQNRQRLTRTRLAQLLNRPDDPPANLRMPDEPDFDAKLPAEEEQLQQVLANSPRLKALRARVESAVQALEASRKTYGPTLRAEAKAGVYNRDMGSYYPAQGGLVFEMPLFTGRAKDAAVAKARAELAQHRAELSAAELAVRQGVLESRFGFIDAKAQFERVQVLGDYREMYLDRSRALYEMEMRTDLGDAMVQMSAVRLEHAKAVFKGLMAQARMAALAGSLINDKNQEGKAP